MNGVKIALAVLISILLVLVILDRSRQTEQMLEFKDSVDRLTTAVQKLGQQSSESQNPLAPAVTPGTQAVAPAADASQPPAVDPVRDGNPKLGVNFLLPYETAHFHPQWLGGTLKAFGATSKSLNPLTDNSGTTQDVHGTINSTLCFRHPASPELWMSALAESVIISDDYKVYTFTLRKGVIWQTPTIASRPEFAWIPTNVEMTAADFVFFFQLVQNPEVNCPSLRVYYEDLDKAEALDKYTLRLTWKRKVYTSLAFSLDVMPMPRHIYKFNRDGTPIPEKSIGVQFNEHWFDRERQAIGVGEYILDTYEPDHLIHYHRNPAFWGAGDHFVAQEDLCDVKQPDAQLVAFKNGDVDFTGLRPNQYKSQILDGHEPRFAAYDPANPKAGRTGQLGWELCKTLRFSYIGWNMRSDLFHDKRVRQAMSYAFPKERILKEVYHGLGEPVLSDVHPDSRYYNHNLKPYDFDPAHALALLKEAGWTDSDGDGILDHDVNGTRKPMRFTVTYYKDSPEWDATLLIYRDELRKIGIDMQLKTLEWPVLMQAYENKDFDSIVGVWGMDLDVDFFQLWHSSQAEVPGSSNTCGFMNKHFDELADRLRVTFDLKERIAIARECQAILNEEQPYTFFLNPHSVFVWQNHGPPAAHDRYLAGVIYGLDHLNPLVNRSTLYWHFVNE